MTTSTNNAADFRISPKDAFFDTPEYRAFELAAGELMRTLGPTNSKDISGLNFAIGRVLCEMVRRTSEQFIAESPDLNVGERLAIFPKVASSLLDTLEEVAKVEGILFVKGQILEMNKSGKL